MGFFDHRHHWRRKAGPDRVMSKENKELAQSVILIEDCHCGAIRQIEYTTGREPTIFVVMTPTAGKDAERV